MLKPFSSRPLLAVLLLSVAACSKCGKSGSGASATTSELTRLVPAEAEAAILVPDLGALGEKLAQLERLKVAAFAAQLQGFPDARAYASALMAQAGVDLRSRDAMVKAGIDPAKGLAVVLLPRGRAYSAVGVKDAAKLKELIQRLAAQRLGAGSVSTRQEGGVEVTRFSSSAGGPPRLGLALKDGYAFIAAAGSVEELAAFSALPRERSLAQDARLSSALGRLPARRDVLAFLPASSNLLPSRDLSGLAVAGVLEPTSFTVHVDVPWTGSGDALAAWTKAGGKADLLAQLPADAFLALRLSSDPAKLAPLSSRFLDGRVLAALKNAGVDLQQEVLANLKPGAVLTLSLAPDVKLAGGMPALDVRQTNPFRYVHLAGLAEVKDPARAEATLAKLPAVGPGLGAKIEAADQGGRKVFLTHYGQGEGVHFAGIGDRVVLASPRPRLAALLEHLGKPSPSGGAMADPALRKVLDEHAVAMVLDLRRLSEAVRALPSDAWGVGGFAMKASTVRWLEATDDLRAITVAADAKDGALQLELRLALQPSAAEANRGEGR